MKQLLILYFITCLLIGTVSLVISILIYNRTKDRFIKYFLTFYIPFSLLLCVSTLDRYMMANGLLNSPEIIKALKLAVFFCLSLLHAFIPIFTNRNMKKRLRLIINIPLVSLAALSFIPYITSIIPAEVPLRTYNSSYFIGETIYIIINLYTLIMEIYWSTKKSNSKKKNEYRFTMTAVIVFIPLLINDYINFLNLPYGAFFFPLLYCCFSGMQLSYIMVNYFNLKKELTSATRPTESFFTRYELTNREQEIFELIVKGYSNAKIAEELFISTMTVKTHVYNIFKKTGVKTRFELTGLLNEGK